jgi:hypothetical protein
MNTVIKTIAIGLILFSFTACENMTGAPELLTRP